MLTSVSQISQDYIIYKCTKLHDHSSERKKKYLLPRAYHIFRNSGKGAFSLPNIFYNFFVLMGTLT